MRVLPLWCSFLLAAGVAPLPVFEDISKTTGITFQHSKSGTSRKYLIESVTGGVAMLDYDGDRWLDLYFVNGAKLKDPMKAGQVPDKSDPRFWNRLYHNRRDGTFEDVSERAGVRGYGYGMGLAVGDFDNDGRPDMYVTNFGRNILYHNKGDGTFEDVTGRAGVAGGGWSTSAAWVDFDGDGRIDVLIANDSYPQQLFRNLGNGRFREMAPEAGIAYDDDARTYGGMGVDFADYDNDGWPDVLINALSTQRYALYRNEK